MSVSLTFSLCLLIELGRELYVHELLFLWLQGFKKVDPDRWEFANEGFLGGQRHLLKSIKRRRHAPHSFMQHQGLEPDKYGVDGAVLERLRTDRSILRVEILKLRQYQQASRARLAAMEERLQETEKKQQQIMAFLAKALRNPTFVRQLVQYQDQKRALDGGSKRRRLDFSYSNLYHGEERTVDSFLSVMINESDGSCGVHKTEIGTVSTAPNDGRDAVWEEMLLGGGEVNTMIGSQTEIDVEVEVDHDLTSKCSDWDDDVQVLVDEMCFLNSKPSI